MNFASWIVLGILVGLFVLVVVSEIKSRKKSGGCFCGCGGCGMRDICHKKKE